MSEAQIQAARQARGQTEDRYLTHEHQPKPQTILYVEDSEDDYESTLRAFKKASLHNPIIWCRSGQAALDYLKNMDIAVVTDGNEQDRPGLILLDLNMPGLDGRKTLELIKQDKALKRIPVIILTTSTDERDVTSCYEMGANTYVQKPVSFEGLIEAIKRLREYWFEIALLPKDGNNV
jgi:two-component system response regulator